MSGLKFAVVCSSNQNRSMEAHAVLKKKGLDVKSFGSGNHVKLPGPTIDKPNIYSFNTSYEDMLRDLEQKNTELYTRNGIIAMLKRNCRVKRAPERWQSLKNERFDVVITCEERVFDQVLADVQIRQHNRREALDNNVTGMSFDDLYSVATNPTHIINITIPDNHNEATLGSFVISEICQRLQTATDIDAEVEKILRDVQLSKKYDILHTVEFY